MKTTKDKSRCKSCKIYQTLPEFACCAWFMDNVVIGDKSVEDCPFFEEADKNEDM